jgi:hypothetical protein
MRTISKTPNTKKRWWNDSNGTAPELKPQYCQKNKWEIEDLGKD